MSALPKGGDFCLSICFLKKKQKLRIKKDEKLMSEYYDFSRCVVCRTKRNLENYCGEFEVTMLINSLYLSLMYAIENRKDMGFRAKDICKFLDENNIVDKHGNSFNSDDILRYLRNSLAHFNIKTDSLNGSISEIKFWGRNQEEKTICKEPCDNPQCIPKQFSSNENGEICTFIFSIEKLKEFTGFVMKYILKKSTSEVCAKCRYNNFEEA